MNIEKIRNWFIKVPPKKEEPVLLTAAELRAHMAEVEAEHQRALEAKQSKTRAAMDVFADEFLHQHLSPEEIADMRKKIHHAVDHGLFEVMVMRFPASLCTDHGRAINSAEEMWPETLTGKARDLYEAWQEKARPAGYHLKAYIIDFPDGVPGDVGMFINWAA